MEQFFTGLHQKASCLGLMNDLVGLHMFTSRRSFNLIECIFFYKFRNKCFLLFSCVANAPPTPPHTLFFIVYTESCRTFQEGSFPVKFFDDIGPLSLIQGSE